MMGHLFGFIFYAAVALALCITMRDARRDPRPSWCDPDAYPCGACPACTR